MTKLDAPELQEDPGALAGAGPDSTGDDTANSPACQMAKLSYKTALGFRIGFTALVFVVSAAAAATLIWAIYKIAKDGTDVGAIISGITGLLGSGAALFLVKRMRQSITVRQAALARVSEYCGEAVTNAITAA